MSEKTSGENFCAIDFETGSYPRASACAVALVRVREGAIADTLYSLIKPPEEMGILRSFTAIHGITMKDVADSPTFEELWPSMREFIGSDFLVAHNAPFDRGVLGACLTYYGIDFPVPRFECTVVASRRAWPALRNHRLDTVSDHLGLELDHHQALSDAIACARIYVAARR
jgi:DNA polymerase-3 subunit epsilon